MKMFGFGRKKTTQSPSTEIPEFISGLPSEVGELSEISEPFDDKDLDDPDLLSELESLAVENTIVEEEPSLESVTVRENIPDIDDDLQTHSDEEVILNENEAVSNENTGSHCEKGTLEFHEEKGSIRSTEELSDEGVMFDESQNQPINSPVSPNENARDDQRNAATSNLVQSIQLITSPQIAHDGSQIDISDQPKETDFPSLEDLISRLSEYKNIAAICIRSGNLSGGREFLRIMKHLQAMVEYFKLKGRLPDGFRLPPKPDTRVISKRPNANTADVKGATDGDKTTENVTALSPNAYVMNKNQHVGWERIDMEDITNMRNQFEYQLQMCTKAAAYYLKQKQNDLAVLFHRRKKSYTAMLENLRKDSDMSNTFVCKIPVEYQYERLNAELKETDMEIRITRATGLNHKEIACSDIDSWISCDFGSNADDSTIPAFITALGKLNTPSVKKSINPEFNFLKVIQIRRDRVFQRFIERRKVTFEVLHNRGFLRKPLSLGKLYLKLNTLLSSCVLEGDFELVDAANPRKFTGGKLQLSIRLRNPIASRDIISRHEVWSELTVSGDNLAPEKIELNKSQIVTATDNVSSKDCGVRETVSKSGLSTRKMKSEPSARHTHEAPEYEIMKSTLKNSIEIEPTQDEIISEEDSVLLDLEHRFLSVDAIVSNEVLEAEKKVIAEKIASLQSRHQDIPEELLYQKQSYDIRINVLVSLVQSEKLTMAEYISQLKSSIMETKKMAIRFKKGGKTALARQALIRIKVMQSELDEVENTGNTE